MGWIVPRRVRVDIHQGCSMRWTQKKPTLEQTILAINTESVGWVTEDFLWDHEWITETKVHSGGTSLRHRSAVPSQMVSVMVFSTNKSHSQVRLQRDTCDQIQGHGQQRNRVDV